MEKPRIIIMEEDFSYAAPLQAKFIYEFLDTIELEVITEAEIAKNSLMNSKSGRIDCFQRVVCFRYESS